MNRAEIVDAYNVDCEKADNRYKNDEQSWLRAIRRADDKFHARLYRLSVK